MVGEQPRAARAADGAEPGHGTSEASRLLAAACHAQTRGHQNEEFRQQFGFLALMLVCGACMVYLMTVLRSILRPFLWALFLVMGLTPAVALVERALLCAAVWLCECGSALLRCVCGWARWVCWLRPKGCRRHGRHRAGGDGHASKRRQARAASATPAVARELSSVIGAIAAGAAATGPTRREGASRSASPSPEDEGRGLGGEPREACGREPRGPEEMMLSGPCARRLVHATAIAAVVAAVVCAIAGFVLVLVQSALTLQEHWAVYRQGAKNLAVAAEGAMVHVSGSIPRQILDKVALGILEHAEEYLSSLITEVLENIWNFVFEFLMMALYMSFWLADPMPVGTQMEELFKRYIILKGLACLGYGTCVGVLLHVLDVDLSQAFGLAAFLLSFVPEVGAIVALLLPAPVILFDSRLEAPLMTLAVATAGQLGLKFVFANVVEVKLVEADQLMKMHPVIILLAVTLFGFIWGPTGMLLAVPLVAGVKVALLSDQVPACYRDPVLVFLEGDTRAPAKYRITRPDAEPPQRCRGGAPAEPAAATGGGDSCRSASAAGLRSTAAGAALAAAGAQGPPLAWRAAASPPPRTPSGGGSADGPHQLGD